MKPDSIVFRYELGAPTGDFEAMGCRREFDVHFMASLREGSREVLDMDRVPAKVMRRIERRGHEKSKGFHRFT